VGSDGGRLEEDERVLEVGRAKTRWIFELWRGLTGLMRKGKEEERKVDVEIVRRNRMPWYVAVIGMVVLSSVQRILRDEEEERRREMGRPGKTQKLVRAASDLAQSGPRDIVIVTTASLPWMTGTSINPLIRALQLLDVGHAVTLVLPFLPPEEQDQAFHGSAYFDSQQDQETFVRGWIREQAPGKEEKMGLLFYLGKYSVDFGSILPVGDVTEIFQAAPHSDFCILEEPEHLTWFHFGRRWTDIFDYVVGIMHTNYLAYAWRFGFFGPVKTVFLYGVNLLVCEIHCNRVIKLSDAVQYLPKATTCNVHGVRERFLTIGMDAGTVPQDFTQGAYFLGKMAWEKGYRHLFILATAYHRRTQNILSIVLYGNGHDLPAIRHACEVNPSLAGVKFYGDALDHGSPDLRKYRVFLNPATSDVICTATAEALAMGKIVVVRKHPSNAFFSIFRNCITFSSEDDFAQAVDSAMSMTPLPLSKEERSALSWTAATDRLVDASRMDPNSPLRNKFGLALHRFHRAFTQFLRP